ncbi:RNA polymerase sigma-28 (SigD/FliA/WhiG) subunit [Streptohalobacillus salinus]|uniref:RNA polymerase sigma-28 (SigD/FliA/WhiG) subunit n=1 Tax=Streptohalobacillus salinus TaxID=621096 RepID=A0A2V3WCN6_9BACI|nr:FliA/WhiG family RNA polymerase sigma factor [Streptohalobacillus salinus]PXW92506.1 RNA polymerase sigma-28 (SigD/FliA/WhiG) subunit [Streptohalobacillus salinus]
MDTENIDVEQLWQDWITTHETDVANRLVSFYMYLVDYHTQRVSVHLPKSVQRDDIKSLALLGLYDAIKKFEPARDLKFDTYASFRIRGAIIDGLRKEDWLPRSSRDRTKKIETAAQHLLQTLQREPTVKEIAEYLDVAVSDVEDSVKDQLFSNLLSIEEKAKDQNEDFKEGIGHSVIDNQQLTPEDSILKQENYQDLANAIKQLNKNEQLVVSLFYHDELTFTEIGQVLTLTTSRISQIHKQAVFKLRGYIES